MARSKSFLTDIIGSFARQAKERDINSAAELLQSKFIECYPARDSMRLAAEILLLHFFDRPAQLFILGQYPAMYLETYAILERFALLQLPNCIRKDQNLAEELLPFFERRTLPDFAPIFITCKKWDSDCNKFVSKFKRIRDAIAHKNDKGLNKALGLSPINPKFAEWNTSNKFNEHDSLWVLLNCIQLTLRLSRKRRSQPWRKLRL